MHRCSNSHGNSVSPCSCGWFPAATSSNSFSMLFSMSNHQYQYQSYDEVISDSYPLSSSSSAVDCTLSLGTPSTRQIDNHNRKSGSCVSNLCWDLFQSKKSSSYKHSTSSSRGGGGGGGGGGSSSGSNTTSTIHNNLNTGDPLLARRCANCDTTSTPLWRNGPRGPKSLCNACGIRYKKEERRASSNATAAAMEQQQHHHHYSSWAHSAQSQRVASISSGSIGNHEFKFIEEDDQCRSSDTTGIPFISWRLNVPDRHSSLVHDYT